MLMIVLIMVPTYVITMPVFYTLCDGMAFVEVVRSVRVPLIRFNK